MFELICCVVRTDESRVDATALLAGVWDIECDPNIEWSIVVRILNLLLASSLVLATASCGDKSVAPTVAMKVGHSVEIGGMRTNMAIDPSTGQLYIGDTDANQISVLDPKSLQVVRSIAADNPADIAISSSTNMLFVASIDLGTVSAFDLKSGAKKASFKTGKFPNRLALNDSAQILYVGNQGSATVSVVQLPLVGVSDNPVFQTLSVTSNPVALKFVAGTQKLFVGSQVDGSVQVIDTNTNTGLLHDQVTVSVTRPDWPVWS